jgi:hypothetical protein
MLFSEVRHMDSYDNDGILMMLDDDLFWVDENVPVLSTESDKE